MHKQSVLETVWRERNCPILCWECKFVQPLCEQYGGSLLRLPLLSSFSHVRLCAALEMAAHQVPHPGDSPGKNTGVGCHFLLQCMKVKSESEVTQSCPTPSDPMDCSLPGSSIHGIFQARVLEWVATTFSNFSHICAILEAF